ncbi:hypothetical protein ACIQVC_36975 [Streptomyces sp. NPDC101112]|uniref:hypothetical protein n=1 Tax=Streptomyces sp. NPDC101112 TaxID=3366105 RepID=UPI0037FC99EC
MSNIKDRITKQPQLPPADEIDPDFLAYLEQLGVPEEEIAELRKRVPTGTHSDESANDS